MKFLTILKIPNITFLIIFGIIVIKTTESQFVNQKIEDSCSNRNEAGKTYLLDPDSNKCSLVGTRGPCPEMMIFYRNPSSSKTKYGFCDCDQGYRSELPCSDNPIRRRVYSHKDKRCYTVFSQGPCQVGKWLILNENDSLYCIKNPCRNYGSTSPSSNQFWFYHPTRKRCYQSLTQGYCPINFHLELTHDSIYPKCRKKNCFSNISHGVRSALICKVGSRLSFLTKSCKSSVRSFFGIG